MTSGSSGPVHSETQAGARTPDAKAPVSKEFPRKPLLDKATTMGIAELLLLGMDRPSRGIGKIDEACEESWIGRLVGDYRIDKELGRGGMGAVFRATNLRVGSTVALKLLRFAPGESAERLRRFELEARASAELNHSNIINVFDVGQMGDLYYLAMEYIEGRPLSEKIEAGPMDRQQMVRVAVDICSALDFAHLAGVIHRDIKPSNILIEPCGRAQLMDFGLARDTGVDSKKLTEAGSIMGTAHYMSPEQAEGRSHIADSRSDIYSIGAVLYEMATGLPPFDGPTQLDVIRKVVEDDPIHPQRIRADLDHDLVIIILKTMEKDPARRYHSAKALSEDLQRFRDGEPILARPPSLFYRTRKFVMKHRAKMIPAVIALIVILGVSLGFSLHDQKLLRNHKLTVRDIHEQHILELNDPNLLSWKLVHSNYLKGLADHALRELDAMVDTQDFGELANRELWRGILAARSGKDHLEEAAEYFRKAHGLGRKASRAELIRAASGYLGEKSEDIPNNWTPMAKGFVLFHLGNHAYLRGDNQAALEYFQRSMESSQDCLESQCAYAAALKVKQEQR